MTPTSPQCHQWRVGIWVNLIGSNNGVSTQFYFKWDCLLFVCSSVFISFLSMNCPIYFIFYSAVCLSLLTLRSYFYWEKKLMLPMIWIAVSPRPPPILYLSLDFIHGFLPYRFCVQKFLFCFLMLSFAILILSCWLKETFPASHLQMNFPTSSYCFYDFHSWMFKKKKKPSIWNCSWCLVWNMDSVFLFSPDGLFYNTIYWKIHLCLHICFNFSLCGFLHCFKVYFQRYCFAGFGCFKCFSH